MAADVTLCVWFACSGTISRLHVKETCNKLLEVVSETLYTRLAFYHFKIIKNSHCSCND